MTKRRIHLTEGQLYGLVEQAINELDWRTYASTANQMAQSWPYKGDSYKRSVALRDAAKDAFKQQNGAEIDMYPDKYPMYSYKGMRNDLNLTHFRDNEKGIDPGRWNGYPEDVDDENGDPIEGVAPEVAQDWENIDKIASFANGWDTYDKEKGKWRTRPTKWVWNDKEGKSHKEFADESLARKVTESVMRKLKRGLKEQKGVSDDLIEFNNAEEALDFVKRHINGNEELFINSEGLTFGLGYAYTWEDMAREFLKSPEAENANVKQGNNDAFLHFGNEATLLAYLRWLEKKEGSLYFLTNPDEEGEPRPLESYI